MPTYKKYSHINFVPPAAVAREGASGLELRRKYRRGGTQVGVARARDLKNRRTLSPNTIKRMVAYFTRHAVDKKGKDFYNAERPSNGYIAWLLWGGDPGREWAHRVRMEMKRADKK